MEDRLCCSTVSCVLIGGVLWYIPRLSTADSRGDINGGVYRCINRHRFYRSCVHAGEIQRKKWKEMELHCSREMAANDSCSCRKQCVRFVEGQAVPLSRKHSESGRPCTCVLHLTVLTVRDSIVWLQ